MGTHDRSFAASNPPTWTPDMLAERWHCSAETVRQMVKRGELHGFRTGRMIRIPWGAIEEHECQTSASADCAADTASIGMTRKRENESVINLRHAPERKPKPKDATGS
ncbi:helix-turn-helix domain-containing protein [Thioclava dalianensis]|uniref:helix-turn-helix domain-containing protein n=1 Tax=Thioclava dalianensis TaxID=1185766 RepID=UPI003CCC3A53